MRPTVETWRGILDKARRRETWIILAMPSVVMVWLSYLGIRALLNSGNGYRVFGSFWVSGWAASHGFNPYAFYPLTWHNAAYPNGPMIYDVNLNPPVVLPLFQLLARFPIREGVIAWSLVSLLLFLAGTAMLFFAVTPQMQKRKVVWLLLSVATFETVALGQLYAIPFFLCCCVALCLISDARPLAAYICIGVLIAMKPNLGLWAVMLFFAGYRKAGIISAATAIALSLAALFIYGPSVYSQWHHAYSVVPHYIFPTDVSIAGVFTRIGSRSAGWVIATALGLALMFFVRRVRPSEAEVSGIAICAAILCSPLAWFQYSLMAAPFFAVSRRWGRLETFAACLMFAPDMQVYVMNATSRGPLVLTLATLPYFLGISLMLASFLRLRPSEVPMASTIRPDTVLCDKG